MGKKSEISQDFFFANGFLLLFSKMSQLNQQELRLAFESPLDKHIHFAQRNTTTKYKVRRAVPKSKLCFLNDQMIGIARELKDGESGIFISQVETDKIEIEIIWRRNEDSFDIVTTSGTQSTPIINFVKIGVFGFRLMTDLYTSTYNNGLLSLLLKDLHEYKVIEFSQDELILL